MLKKLLGISLIILYLLFLNNLAFFFNIFYEDGNPIPFYKSRTDYVKIGVSDSVSISVMRPRFYGKFVEESSNKTLYFLNFINIPIKYKGINFLYFHGVFLLLFTLLMKGGKKMNTNIKSFLWLAGAIAFWIVTSNSNSLLAWILWIYLDKNKSNF